MITMDTPVTMHAARTALNRNPELREWAERWLKAKERAAQAGINDKSLRGLEIFSP